MYNVIVVDDDRTNTQLIQLVLEMDGYAVKVCPTIARAVDSCTPDTDAFIIDYHLAGGRSGTDLVLQIRAGETEAPSSSAVIITSGDRRVHEVSLTSGANLFIQKPYSPSELSETLRQLLVEAEQRG